MEGFLVLLGVLGTKWWRFGLWRCVWAPKPFLACWAQALGGLTLPDSGVDFGHHDQASFLGLMTLAWFLGAGAPK